MTIFPKKHTIPKKYKGFVMYDWKAEVSEFLPNGASVPFVEFERDGVKYFGFDSRSCVPPEPMVNAIIGLKMLDNENKKLIMVNHRSPVGLLAKIEDFYKIETKELENGAFELTFSYIDGKSDKADLTDSSCAG